MRFAVLAILFLIKGLSPSIFRVHVLVVESTFVMLLKRYRMESNPLSCIEYDAEVTFQLLATFQALKSGRAHPAVNPLTSTHRN